LICQGKLPDRDRAENTKASGEARRLILDAAASLLAEGGIAAVQVRAVAARVGMTDAA